MALFRLGLTYDHTTFVRGDGVFLRPAEMADFEAWARLRERSRAFLTPWEPIWPADDLTRGGFKRRLKRYNEDFRGDQAYPFFLFQKGTNRLVGGLTLLSVAWLGLWLWSRGKPSLDWGH